MANENAKIDDNYKKTITAITDDINAEIRRLLVDPTTGRLKVSATIASGAITSLNSLTTATQLLATGSSGTDFVISSSGSTHTFNIPTASAANRGLLSTTDWTTFNDKAPTDSPTFSGTVTSGGTILAQQAIQLNTTAYFDAEYNNGNSGAAITIDWKNGNKQLITLTGSGTITMVAPPGPCNLTLRLAQDTSSGRTMAFYPIPRFSGGSALSTGSSAIDVASFYWNGTTYYGIIAKGFVT